MDLNLRVRLVVAGGDFALAGGFDIDGLGSVAVKTGDDALHVENDLGHILGHAGDGGKLMLDAGDLDLCDRPFPGREERRTRRRELPKVVP